jgi:hypothetical protein
MDEYLYNADVRTSRIRDRTEIKAKVSAVPQVTIRNIVDGREETLTEYLCDWPDCPNVAIHLVGVVRELRIRAAVCAEHVAHIANRRKSETER